jgi:hypothetical protein
MVTMAFRPVRIAAGETVARSRVVSVRRVSFDGTQIGTQEIGAVSDQFVHHAPKIAAVGADMTDPVEYNPSPPVVRLQPANYTRDEWQEVKRGIDQAFDEHERLWPRAVAEDSAP